jgi:hypothetical protein
VYLCLPCVAVFRSRSNAVIDRTTYHRFASNAVQNLSARSVQSICPSPPPHRYFYVGPHAAQARRESLVRAQRRVPPPSRGGYVPLLCVCASCHMHRCQPHHWRVSSERGSSPASYMNEHTPSQHNCLATRHPSALSVIAAQWYQAFVVVRDLKCLYAMPVGSQVCCCLWL